MPSILLCFYCLSALTPFCQSKFCKATFHVSSNLICQFLSVAQFIKKTSTTKSVFLWYQSQRDIICFLKLRMTSTWIKNVENSSYHNRDFLLIIRNELTAHSPAFFPSPSSTSTITRSWSMTTCGVAIQSCIQRSQKCRHPCSSRWGTKMKKKKKLKKKNPQQPADRALQDGWWSTAGIYSVINALLFGNWLFSSWQPLLIIHWLMVSTNKVTLK